MALTAAQKANARIRYGQKTVDARGANRTVDDTSKMEGYMIDNGDGTYSNYTPDGTLERTYKAPGGLLDSLGSNIESIAKDESGVFGKFVAPALAMGYGASLMGGAETGGAESLIAGGGGGGAEVSPYALNGGSATFGAASPAATNAALGGAGVGLTGAGGAGAGLLSGLGTAGTVMAAGGLLGALAGKDTQSTQTSSRDPWGPAQPYLLDNLKTNAAMQKYYQENPFSAEQKRAYQGVFDSNANAMANAPVMSGIANNFMASKRGQMGTMPQFTQGTTAPAVDWTKYQNIGLLKG